MPKLSAVIAFCLCLLLLGPVYGAPSPQVSEDVEEAGSDLNVGAEVANEKDAESDLEGASSYGYGYYAYPSYVGGIYGGYGGYGHYPYYSGYYGLGYPSYYSGYYGGYHGLHGHYF